MRFTIIYDNHTFNLAGSYIFSKPFSVCAFLTMREFFPCAFNPSKGDISFFTFNSEEPPPKVKERTALSPITAIF